MGVKMKKTNLEFLSLLKASLKNEKYDGEKIDFEDLVYIYKMSEIHHPYNQLYIHFPYRQSVPIHTEYTCHKTIHAHD